MKILEKLLDKYVKPVLETLLKKETHDLTDYNLKDGLSDPPFSPVIEHPPAEMIESAKKRMNAYRALEEERMKDMKAFEDILKAEAKKLME